MRQSNVLHWCILSLALAVLGADEKAAGANPLSRFALLRAMAVDHSFHIDRYLSWTVDWARTPDGHHYSNKAPGPSFLALPFEALDHRDERPPAPWLRNLISILLQAVPFSLLTLVIGAELQKRGRSLEAQNFAAVAILLGNTAAVFMGVFFGHALSACLLLSAILCCIQERWFWTGMALGWLILSDYGAGVLLVPAGISMAMGARGIGKALLGAALPAALWIVYHTICFGSPWTLPMAFQNPAVAIEGTFSIAPPADVAGELLWGRKRGLLFTQPWLPLLWLICVARAYRNEDEVPRPLLVFSLLGLPLLFWVNAGFSGWHGGESAGPRYMSVVFPLYGWLAGHYYDRINKGWRILLLGGLGIAVLLRWLIQTKDVLPPMRSGLWNYYYANLQASSYSERPWISFAIFGVLLLSGLWLTDRELRRPRASGPRSA
jgi:hypothetical protein